GIDESAPLNPSKSSKSLNVSLISPLSGPNEPGSVRNLISLIALLTEALSNAFLFASWIIEVATEVARKLYFVSSRTVSFIMKFVLTLNTVVDNKIIAPNARSICPVFILVYPYNYFLPLGVIPGQRYEIG